MMVASLLNKKVFTSIEYFCAVAVCTGLVFFAAADWSLAPTFHPIGLVLVGLSVCADAILPNAQERLFRLGSSRLEVTFYTNFFTLICMTITTYLSGDLLGIIAHAAQDRQLALYMGVYTLIAYVAISMHMTVVKRFGGVAAVVLATARKGMTLVLSFILFPKAFSWFYVLGAILVLGGLLISSLLKIHHKNKRNAQQHDTQKQSEVDIDSDDDVEEGTELRKNLLGGAHGHSLPDNMSMSNNGTNNNGTHHRPAL
jgi:adenosine 3'-phospho 5'-phosphosulfate transporter B3